MNNPKKIDGFAHTHNFDYSIMPQYDRKDATQNRANTQLRKTTTVGNTSIHSSLNKEQDVLTINLNKYRIVTNVLEYLLNSQTQPQVNTCTCCA